MASVREQWKTRLAARRRELIEKYPVEVYLELLRSPPDVTRYMRDVERFGPQSEIEFRELVFPPLDYGV
jgi:hypothetical protein